MPLSLRGGKCYSHWYAAALLVLGLLMGFYSQAQILDDTTKQKYGTRTTRFRYLQDVMDNRDTLHRIDTVLRNFQNNDDYILRGPWPMQDLGNMGTAQRAVFPTGPRQIGLQYGFNSFDQFAYDMERTRFYNTFSPHTWADYSQGPEERSSFEAGFARNINNRSAISLEYRTINSNKFFGRVRSEDPQANHQTLRLTGSYISPKAQFQSYAAYIYSAHRQNETGGVLPTARDSTRDADPLNRRLIQDSLLILEIQRPQLTDGAISYEDRNTFRWYNQLALDSTRNWQLWYQLDHQWRRQGFEMPGPSSAPYFRDSIAFPMRFGVDSNGNPISLGRYNYNDAYTNDETRFGQSVHTLGLKGGIGQWRVGGHLRYRFLSYGGNRFSYTGPTQELYVGGHAIWNISKVQQLRLDGQTVLGRDLELNGNYHDSHWHLSASIKRFTPTLFQQQFYGNHQSWNRELDFVTYQDVTAEYLVPLKSWELKLGASVQQWQNQIYFNQRATPEQASGGSGLNSIWLKTDWKWWRIRTEQTVRYSLPSGADVNRVPNLWVHWRTYFEYHPAKARNIEVMAGLDIRYRSQYLADYYMATTQQFYLQPGNNDQIAAALQHQFPLVAAVVVDPYFTMRVNRTLVFVKVSNVLQGVGGNGYFTTPFYPGMNRNFQFGIKWYFFD